MDGFRLFRDHSLSTEGTENTTKPVATAELESKEVKEVTSSPTVNPAAQMSNNGG